MPMPATGSNGHIYQTIVRSTLDQTEPKKVIISNRLYDMLVWHIWTVISVSVSITLVCLNLKEYSIAGEIGGSAGATANILGALQLAIKAHELTIVASLYMIARQWIQGSLINLDKGIPLGLLGAEKKLGQPSFLISKGYLVTVRYVVSLWRRKQARLDLCFLTIFLFAATVVSSLAGPASGVLMIPHPDWFFDSVVPDTVPAGQRYSYLMVRPKFEYERSGPFDAFSTDNLHSVEYALRYWSEAVNINRMFGALPQTQTTYNLVLGSDLVCANISTTWNRTLENNTGRTNAKMIMIGEIRDHQETLNVSHSTGLVKHAAAMLRWSGRKYVADGIAVDVESNCHYRLKEKCPPTADNKNMDWCPQNLVLLSHNTHISTDYTTKVRALDMTRVYMTEGPRTQKYPEFTDSYEVIFDDGIVPWSDDLDFLPTEKYINIPIPTSRVIVCSILTTMQPAVITSLAVRFKAEYADYPSPENRTILFHEGWLDGTNWLYESPGGNIPEPLANRNLTFPPRNMSDPTGNLLLRLLGEVIAKTAGTLVFMGPDEVSGASHLETVVSGTFSTVYALSERSLSQYPAYLSEPLPESLMPETLLSTPARNLTISIYNFGYGYRLSSRTGILGMTILIVHAVIVVLGSIWQLFWRRSVISAWDTIPDYVALALGSVTPDVLDNTCAGIVATKSLQNIVTVGETTNQHLEIAAGEQDPSSTMRSVQGRFDAKYGSQSGKRKEKLE